MTWGIWYCHVSIQRIRSEQGAGMLTKRRTRNGERGTGNGERGTNTENVKMKNARTKLNFHPNPISNFISSSLFCSHFLFFHSPCSISAPHSPPRGLKLC